MRLFTASNRALVFSFILAGCAGAQADDAIYSPDAPASQAELEQLKAEVEAGEQAHADVLAEIAKLKAESEQLDADKAQLEAQIQQLEAEVQNSK